jgi:hypothetical protein
VNIQTKLKRLEERFLRADTGALIDSACTEGGLILKEMFDSGNTAGNPELARLLQTEYLTTGANPMETLLDEFKLQTAFKLFARSTSSDPNVLAMKEISNENGCSVHEQKPNSFRELGERLAAFCVQLSESIQSIAEDTNKFKYSRLREMYLEAKNNTKLSKSEQSYRAITERYWKTLDTNNRPSVATLKKWLERPENH